MGPFWTVLALSYPFTVAAYTSLRGDIWWNLSVGRWILENWALPTAYPFSAAPQVGQFYDTQWLAHLASSAIFDLLGLQGVVAVNALVAAATFAFVVATCWRRSQNRFVAAGCTLGCALVATSNLQPRAQAFAFLLFAATIWLLSGSRRGLGTLAALGGIQLLWTNVHGSYFLGPALTGALLAGEVVEAVHARRWHDREVRQRIGWLGLALLVQGAASLVTPYGLSGLSYAYGAMTDPIARRYNEEWLAPTLSSFTGAAFFVSASIVLGALVLSRGARPADLFVVGLFFLFGLQAVRNVIWWGIAIAPILAFSLTRTALGPRLAALEASARAHGRDRRRVDTIMAGFLLVLMASTLPWVKELNPMVAPEDRQLVSSGEPERAAAFADAHGSPGRIFAPQVWGSYLGWRLWPRFTVMVGPIVEIHPTWVWEDYFTISGGADGWESLLDRYEIDLLMLDATEQAHLVERARASSRWTEVYADGQATIFRRTGPTSAIARRLP